MPQHKWYIFQLICIKWRFMMLSKNLKYFIVYILSISLCIIIFLFHVYVIVILNWCSIYKSTVHLIMKSWHVCSIWWHCTIYSVINFIYYLFYLTNIISFIMYTFVVFNWCNWLQTVGWSCFCFCKRLLVSYPVATVWAVWWIDEMYCVYACMYIFMYVCKCQFAAV